MSGEAGYAVVDVETTGLGRKDKVIEIGIVLLDARYRVIDEYETLIDPCRDLGPTHVHGITPRMVSMAPCFPEVATAIAKRIDGRTLVAHNLLFDERMLGQEFGLLDAMFDSGIGVCTLRLTRQKLPMACKHFGIDPPKHHRALADARACASLLRAISPTCDPAPLRIHNIFGALSVRTHRRCAGDDTVAFDRLLSRVIYDEGDTRVVQYMDLLDWVLDDLVLTADERQHLNFLAEELQLSPQEVSNAHEQYFQSMVDGAEKDGVITEDEHMTLAFVARALGIEEERVPPMSEDVAEIEVLKPGSCVCFTGTFVDSDGSQIPKADLESLARQRGFTVVSSVTKRKCDFVVAVDPASSSTKAKKAREYGKPVVALKSFMDSARP